MRRVHAPSQVHQSLEPFRLLVTVLASDRAGDVMAFPPPPCMVQHFQASVDRLRSSGGLVAEGDPREERPVLVRGERVDEGRGGDRTAGLLAFEDGADFEPVGPAEAAPAAAQYFNNRKLSIFGGSNEIQRNIITKMILGL